MICVSPRRRTRTARLRCSRRARETDPSRSLSARVRLSTLRSMFALIASRSVGSRSRAARISRQAAHAAVDQHDVLERDPADVLEHAPDSVDPRCRTAGSGAAKRRRRRRVAITITRQSRYSARNASEPNMWKCVSIRPPVIEIRIADHSIWTIAIAIARARPTGADRSTNATGTALITAPNARASVT